MECFHTVQPGIEEIIDNVDLCMFHNKKHGEYQDNSVTYERIRMYVSGRRYSGHIESVPISANVIDLLGMAVDDEAEWDKISYIEILVNGIETWEFPISLLRKLSVLNSDDPKQIRFPPHLLYRYMSGNLIPYQFVKSVAFKMHTFHQNTEATADMLVGFRSCDVKETSIGENHCYDSFLINQYREDNRTFGKDTDIIPGPKWGGSLFATGVFFIVHSGEELGDEVIMELRDDGKPLYAECVLRVDKVKENLYYASLCGIPEWDSPARPPYTINLSRTDSFRFKLLRGPVADIEIIPVTLNGWNVVSKNRLNGVRFMN